MKKYLEEYIQRRLKELKEEKKELVRDDYMYGRCCGKISALEDILKKIEYFV